MVLHGVGVVTAICGGGLAGEGAIRGRGRLMGAFGALCVVGCPCNVDLSVTEGCKSAGFPLPRIERTLRIKGRFRELYLFLLGFGLVR